MTWISGPSGTPEGITRPTRVIVGLAHRGDELVIALIMESAEFLTPITVALTTEQARALNKQLAVTLFGDGIDGGAYEPPSVVVDGRTVDAGGDGPHDRRPGR